MFCFWKQPFHLTVIVCIKFDVWNQVVLVSRCSRATVEPWGQLSTAVARRLKQALYLQQGAENYEDSEESDLSQQSEDSQNSQETNEVDSSIKSLVAYSRSDSDKRNSRDSRDGDSDNEAQVEAENVLLPVQ